MLGFGVVDVVEGGCTPRWPLGEPVGFGVLDGRGGYVCAGLEVVVVRLVCTAGLCVVVRGLCDEIGAKVVVGLVVNIGLCVDGRAVVDVG